MDSKTTTITIHSDWSHKINYIDYLQIKGDSLFAVKRNGPKGAILFYINQVTGNVSDTLLSRIDKPYNLKESERRIEIYGCKGIPEKVNKVLLEITRCHYIITNDYKGTTIILETVYRNIRSSDNVVHKILVIDNNQVVRQYAIDKIYDFVVYKDVFFVFSSDETGNYLIKKYSLKKIIN
jgi:hypothetical protein